MPLGNYGETYRPTPSKKSVGFVSENVRGMEKEKYVYCKLCGFPVKTDRDSKCPFCESEMYNK